MNQEETQARPPLLFTLMFCVPWLVGGFVFGQVAIQQLLGLTSLKEWMPVDRSWSESARMYATMYVGVIALTLPPALSSAACFGVVLFLVKRILADSSPD